VIGDAGESRATWMGAMAGDTGAHSSGASRVVMQTLEPARASVVKRGGPGHDFWGHPHNPDAQYNHTLDKDGLEQAVYRRPPYSPWRLEVEPPERRERDYFLNLLFVLDEPAPEIPQAERIGGDGVVGARFALGDRTVRVAFRTSGPIGGHLAISEGGRALWDAALPTQLEE
jgi:hypothetical protein